MTDAELDALIGDITTAHRERCFWMKARIQLDNQLQAFLRLQMGWHKGLAPPESKRIKDEAKRVVALGERYRRDVAKAAKKSVGKEDQMSLGDDAQDGHVPLPADLADYAPIVLPTLAIREVPALNEGEPKKRMEELARQLPVWSQVREWRGFGAISLATIVAEVGKRLDVFPTKGKLNKRLSIGVIDGIRQGGLRKTASKDDWKKHAYNPQRRSRMSVIGVNMLRLGNPRFRALYDSRKIYEIAAAEAAGLTVLPAAKIPKANAERYRSLKHVDLRARRYAEQHIVYDVWRAWHRAHAPVGKEAAE